MSPKWLLVIAAGVLSICLVTPTQTIAQQPTSTGVNICLSRLQTSKPRNLQLACIALNGGEQAFATPCTRHINSDCEGLEDQCRALLALNNFPPESFEGPGRPLFWACFSNK